MDIATLVNIGVIGIFVFVAILIYVNLRARKKYLASDSREEQSFKKWLNDNKFAFDDFHFYRGAGIAIKNGETKFALTMQGSPAFRESSDFSALSTAEEVIGRMVGAAPGVVRQVNTTLYILEMKPKSANASAFRLTFSEAAQRVSWETRLRELIGA